MCYSLRYSRKKKRRKRSLLVFSSSLSLFFSSPLVVERTRRKKFSRLLICWGAKNSKNKFKKFGRAFFFLSVSSRFLRGAFLRVENNETAAALGTRCALSLSVQVARAQTENALLSKKPRGGRKKKLPKKSNKNRQKNTRLPPL